MIPEAKLAPRFSPDEPVTVPRPTYAVWEVTLRCDQPCAHCGSRAGKKRARELTTAEMLAVARTLVDMGCREVALIGGEAYLRSDLGELVEVLAKGGVRVSMQTGGRTLTLERARTLKNAGLYGIGVSVDGPAAVHDELRGNVGSHAAAIRALDASRDAGLVVTSNTQINRLNAHLLRETVAEVRAHGVVSWQVQFTVPMGRAADRPESIIEPWRVVEVIDTLADIQLEAARTYDGGVPFNVCAGNNIGYFGPHEQVLRSSPGSPELYWSGCSAGVATIGIESDGTVKGCPSLPTAAYSGGSVLETPLEELWNHEAVAFMRERSTAELWGHCKDCYYADICLGGCSWTTHVTFGRRGNNPFCYHRVKELQKRGIRERLVQTARAPGVPFDHGVFRIVEEPYAVDLDDDGGASEPKRRRLALL